MSKNIKERSYKSLTEVFAQYANAPLTTNEEIKSMISRIQQGLPGSMDDLKRTHMRFVASVAKQYQDKGLTTDELIEAGTNGLELAAQKFDQTQKFKFICYAVWWIRQNILQAIKDKQDETK